ncbi:unnamed protein product [Sphenostylis stenocarpa]|uniref:Gnk2-homologous domain-containing protein n=1 Tax=Sphenostylis stenocarpa TaxID=92480 RepID=A0AA86SK56_9FABA|nr:unnamed protein product [Sphenostylis stenocarpa]
MDPCNVFFLFILVSFLSFATTQAESDSNVYLYHNCSGGNTTNGSTFQSNLKTLLSSLSDNAPGNNGFYNNTVPGQNPSDSVFGLFMCRADVSSQICQQCVQGATQLLSSECSLAQQAVIWYDECTVRYSNRSFFSTFSTRPRVGLLNTANISNQESFMTLLFQTMNKTADTAAAAVGNKFAKGQANISGFQSLYCLAQCTPDLSPNDCRTYSEFSEDPNYLNHNCSTNGTGDSVFKTHLSTLLSYMSSNATNHMDYMDGVEDNVYGLFMCRGDLPSRLCQQCVLNATHRISSECNSFQEAIIWYNHCMLRYSYRHFFSQVEKSPTIQILNLIMNNSHSDVREQDSFTYTLTKTLSDLTELAQHNNSRYVTKSSKVSDIDSQVVYTLAQCTQDLSRNDCFVCLEDMTKNMPWSRLGSTRQGRILYPSCNLRYDSFQFYIHDYQWPRSGNSSPPDFEGKRNASSYDQARGVADGLLNYVWRQWRDQTMCILDPSIKENYFEEEVLKCTQIGLLCVQQNPDARPTMVEVVSYLSNHLIELPNPEEPAFLLHGGKDSKSFAQESSSRSSGCTPFSINEMPTSQFLPR